MLFNLWEIIQIIITILALGFIFSGHFKKPKTSLEELMSAYKGKFNWIDIKYAALITAPAVILHELSHKFVALGYGFDATYAMSLWGLSLGVILRLFGSSFIFFIPGYVAISGYGTQLQFALIAVAGPLTNLALFGISSWLLNSNKYPKYAHAFALSKIINFWLFVFNMLPIPGFDGFKVYSGLFKYFF